MIEQNVRGPKFDSCTDYDVLEKGLKPGIYLGIS